MENIKMQPGRFYITTDDGKKLEFDGVVEFKPGVDDAVPKLNKKISDLSFSGSATFVTPIKKFLEAVFGSFRKKKGRRDKYQQFKQ